MKALLQGSELYFPLEIWLDLAGNKDTTSYYYSVICFGFHSQTNKAHEEELAGCVPWNQLPKDTHSEGALGCTVIRKVSF